VDRGGARRLVPAVALTAALLAPLAARPPVVRAGGGLGAPAGQVATPEEEGRVLYLAFCARCHGQAGVGTPDGPPIRGLGPAVYDFQLSTGRMPLTRPAAQAVRKPPAFTRPQIDALVAYLDSLQGGGIPIPRVDPAAGSLAAGQQLYQANCAACHGAAGNGGAVGRGYAPNLHVATPVQVAEAVRTGPGAMPNFDPSTLPDDQLDDLVRYVLYLRDPEDPGGASLGWVGPIVEGFVALLVGLGALVLVIRFAGERS
jgi:ubiquinol-cytochrome c reductase cytochrome c subunit